MLKTLRSKKHWIFDMDGTLTRSIHDFDEIRRELGLPENQSIIEGIQQLDPATAEKTQQKLAEIELDIALRSTPAEGIVELLQTLLARGSTIGILTRNSLKNTHVTLDAAGLAQFFQADSILSRDCATPKPSADGIQRLLSGWSGDARDAVMLGDYHYDLDAGKAANVTSVYVDPTEVFPFKDRADICIASMTEITAILKVTDSTD